MLHTVNTQQNDGSTEQAPNYCKGSNAPLHLAKTASIVSALVDAGAVLDIRDENGWTPLIYASSNGHLETVRALVEECGANVEAKDNTGDNRDPEQ